MNIEKVREYCLHKPYVTESFPFRNDVLVFKVFTKMFAAIALTEGKRINLKCEPNFAIELRLKYPDVIFPGYHMNKTHWNTVVFNQVAKNVLIKLIDHSYQLVTQNLTAKQREQIKNSQQEP